MDRTEVLSDFLLSIPSRNLDDAVTDRAKVHIMDTLGVAIGGSRTPHAEQSFETIEALGSHGDVTVIARNATANVLDAAFLNGVSAHSIDFDDAHRFVHAGAAVVPAALAFAEFTKSSGSAFLSASVAGYEGSVRVALAGGPLHRKRGFHPTGTCNVVGSAASAAVLMGLDLADTVSAIGIACSQAGGLTQYRIDGAATKHLHAGFAARAGGLAVLLAKKGLRGTKQAIDGELGFLKVLADGGDPEKLTEGLGETFGIATTDIKPFPSCRQTHAPVDLALKLVHEKGLKAKDIESVELRTYEYCNKHWHVTTESPPTSLEAMLNIPYCVVMALAEGALTLEHFSDEALQRRDVRALMDKTKVVVDDELTKAWPDERGAILVVKAAGKTFTERAANPQGGIGSPLSFDDVATKFRGLSDPVLGPSASNAIVEIIHDIEREKDMSRLCGLLAGSH
jgi:2-methylcitrate dehydratase PrpD